MKRILIMLAVALLATACVTTQNDGLTKEQRKALKAQRVREQLAERRYTIEVEQCYPRRAPARRVDFGYSLTVSGDTLKSYLPYFGRAYHIPYGGGKGLHFTSIIDNYQQGLVKKGLTRIVIVTHNEEDIYQYTLEVFENGNSSIDVMSRQREEIMFSGTMKTD